MHMRYGKRFALIFKLKTKQMKTFYTLIIAIFSSISVFAQTTPKVNVTGTILDENKKPIDYATVVLYWIFRPILHHPFRGIVHQSFRAKVHQFLFEAIKYSEAEGTTFASYQDYFILPFRHILHHYI